MPMIFAIVSTSLSVHAVLKRTTVLSMATIGA